MAEEVIDFGVGDKKALGAWCCPKTWLLPFLLPNRMGGLLNEVILAGRRTLIANGLTRRPTPQVIGYGQTSAALKAKGRLCS